VGSAVYQGIKAMVGKHELDKLLSELAVTGGYSRQDWLRLLPEQIALVREAARSEKPSEGKYEGGARYRPKADGAERHLCLNLAYFLLCHVEHLEAG